MIFTKSETKIEELRQKIEKRVDLINLGQAQFYLGIEIIRNRKEKTLILTQRNFLQGLLSEFATGVKPAPNPCQMGYKLEPNPDQASAGDIHRYQQQIGSLMYLMTATRPDLAFPIGQAARFMSNPNPDHQKALNRIWQYLSKTADFGLVYQSENEPKLEGYCDSDWGGDLSTRKSTTGYLFRFGTSAISWSSALQKTVALSSCEAEYMALKDAIKEQIYLQGLFDQIPALRGKTTEKLFTDSQSAILLAKNPAFHKRTKHIDIQYHFVRNANLNGETNLVYIPTEKQLADSLTKSVNNETWNYFVSQLGLRKINPNKDQGGV